MITIIRKGLHYAISTFSGKDSHEIIFNHRDKEGRLVDGVTREDIYEMLIDVITAANEKNPKHENKIQLRHIEAALESQRVTIRKKIRDEKSYKRQV